MSVGQRTRGSQTSAWPASADALAMQAEGNDPVSENPTVAEARDWNILAAITAAIQEVMGATPRGLVEVAAAEAAVGSFKVYNPVTGAILTFAGATGVALTPATANYIFVALPGMTVSVSTSGFPAASSPHVALAVWPGTGTAVVDVRATLTASAFSAVVAHVHAAADVTSGTFADARIAQSNVTQHQAALAIAATQLTGDIAIARIAAALLLSAKGDILSHTGAAFGKLAVGADGTVLTADAAAPNGIKWAPPASHATSHEDGGGDEIDVTGLSGLLADPQTPDAHASGHENGGADEISVAGLSGELADPQRAKGRMALGSVHTNATITPTDVTAHTSSMVAGETYLFWGVYRSTVPTAADGFRIDFDGGTATFTTFWASVSASDTAFLGRTATGAKATDITFTTTTGDTEEIVHGYAACAVSGTFIPRIGKEANAGGATLTVAVGSWFIVERIS